MWEWICSFLWNVRYHDSRRRRLRFPTNGGYVQRMGLFRHRRHYSTNPPCRWYIFVPPRFLANAKGKYYTLTLSNKIAEKRPDGRDKSTILYEYSFMTYNGTGASLKIGWDEFKPMYRGRPKEDAPKLDVSKIRRWSFMIRSFFDTQYGDFSLEIMSLHLVKLPRVDEKEEERKERVEKVQVTKKSRECCTLQ